MAYVSEYRDGEHIGLVECANREEAQEILRELAKRPFSTVELMVDNGCYKFESTEGGCVKFFGSDKIFNIDAWRNVNPALDDKDWDEYAGMRREDWGKIPQGAPDL